MMNPNIKKVMWFSQGQNPWCLGVVLIENEIGERKAYLGSGLGIDADEDANAIYIFGARIYPEAMSDIEKFLKEEAHGESSKD